MCRVNAREITAFTQDVITQFLVSGGNAKQFITFDDVYIHKIREVKKTSYTYEDISDNITRTFFVPQHNSSASEDNLIRLTEMNPE